MKKYAGIVVVAAVMLGSVMFSFAQRQQQGMGGGMMMRHEEGGTGGMCGGLMGKAMVASDGGVIVLMGDKLLKYDKNLKLVQEVTIQIDMKAMWNRMSEQCPMMQQGTHQSTGTITR